MPCCAPNPPARAIVGVARAEHADLIVMASHQRHGFNRWLHGSVTEDVLQNTSTPLLVVPAKSVQSSGRTLRVLVPLDGSPAGEAALDFLSGRSSTRPMELVLPRIVAVGPVFVGWDSAVIVPPMDAVTSRLKPKAPGPILCSRRRGCQPRACACSVR